MSKYIKPTILLNAMGTTTAAASTCSGSTTDANTVKEILISMGYDPNTAFSSYEPCSQPVDIGDYCKFTSSIQVFFS